MRKTNDKQKGFTLIELLVVIAIIAVLSVVVILTLNPAELLRQSRDAGRISDLSTIKTAISLYIVDSKAPNLASSSVFASPYAACYLSTTAGNGTSSNKCGVFAIAGTSTQIVSTTAALYRRVDSTGWIPVNFSLISAGTPFGNLPVDPSNNSSFFYAYAASSTYVFEVDAFMESSKYSTNGTMTNDGGDNSSTYEAGSNLTL